MRSLLVVSAVVMALGWPSEARAGEWGWCPGVKLAWTFGRGVTYGVEVSFIRLPDLDVNPADSILVQAFDAAGEVITRTYGIVVNIDSTFKGLTKMRVGGEWIGPFIGLEAGPSLVWDRKGLHGAFGLTLWAGIEVIPFYTHTWVFGSDGTAELGVYFKAPLLGFHGGGDSPDFDDHDFH